MPENPPLQSCEGENDSFLFLSDRIVDRAKEYLRENDSSSKPPPLKKNCCVKVNQDARKNALLVSCQGTKWGAARLGDKNILDLSDCIFTGYLDGLDLSVCFLIDTAPRKMHCFILTSKTAYDSPGSGNGYRVREETGSWTAEEDLGDPPGLVAETRDANGESPSYTTNAREENLNLRIERSATRGVAEHYLSGRRGTEETDQVTININPDAPKNSISVSAQNLNWGAQRLGDTLKITNNLSSFVGFLNDSDLFLGFLYGPDKERTFECFILTAVSNVADCTNSVTGYWKAIECKEDSRET